MNDLIKIVVNENQEPTMSGRELHAFLEIGTAYKDWFPRMKEYGFDEPEDYTPLIFEHPQNKQPCTDHILKLDMAKEIAMIQRSEKGKLARQYFLQIEKDWNSPEKVIARALIMANKKLEFKDGVIKMQEKQIEELKPLAAYVKTILNNKSLVTVEQIAQDYGMSAQKLNKILHELHIQYKGGNGQWILYREYKPFGYVHSETISFKRSDGRSDSTMHTKWTQAGRMFLYEELREQGILPLIERDLEGKAI
ncbi:phage antirepressor KilAC domain-containing protein [Acetobacterium sp.]|uniref:phage antirepressor KilAC domain-containing protein n=1 Tax=Acetobacterium sp. TaxID=1872094 RepID=UPI00271E56F1|nr:phage antirepressor KilAC domain-containing protein [Acetobacterium sp.]MDO9492846.1 phage antirepressor KilAC domain-containing protein [Acetobacterium sp.]